MLSLADHVLPENTPPTREANTVTYYSGETGRNSTAWQAISLEKAKFLSPMPWKQALGTWICHAIFSRLFRWPVDEALAMPGLPVRSYESSQ